MRHWLRSGLGAIVVLACFTSAPFARAQIAPPDYSADLCDAAIANGARRGGVPIEVLQAISLTETGRKQNGRLRPWPWAINREGEGFWFPDRDSALAFAKSSLAEGRTSFDVGCVQINYRWHGHAFPTIDVMFDPEWTATYAAQFLRNLYEERGDWSEAAGAYHSLTPEHATKYRAVFNRHLASLAPGGVPDLPAIAHARSGGIPGIRYRLDPVNPHYIPPPMALDDQRPSEPTPFAPIERFEAANGGVSGMIFNPDAGAVLREATPLLRDGQPLLNTPPDPLF